MVRPKLLRHGLRAEHRTILLCQNKVLLVPISHAMPLSIYNGVGRATTGRPGSDTGLEKQHRTMASWYCFGQHRRCSTTSNRPGWELGLSALDTDRQAASPMQGWNDFISSLLNKVCCQDGALASRQHTLHDADAVALPPYHLCLSERESITYTSLA